MIIKILITLLFILTIRRLIFIYFYFFITFALVMETNILKRLDRVQNKTNCAYDYRYLIYRNYDTA